MKKTLIALAALAAVAVTVPAAMAEFSPGQGTRGGPNVEMMGRILDLTPDQQEKLKNLYAEQAKQREAMRASMRADMQAKLQAILTKDQYAKMMELRKFRGDHRGYGQRAGSGDCRGQGGGMPRQQPQ